MNKDKIKILVCCHKKTDLPKDESGILFPIHVGAALSNIDLGMQRDDLLNGNPCDNISEKNGSYCELTAIYWAWKNIKKIYPNLEYIGLNHYRRYFSLNRISYIKHLFKEKESEITNYELPLKKLNHLLSNGFTIISSRDVYAYPLAFSYALAHHSEDLKIFAKIASEKNPKGTDILKKHLLHNNKLSPFNMFIMKWDAFDKYCNWLFETLEKTEKYIDISSYSSVQKRIYGYMAERFLNVFCQTENLKIKYVPVVQYVNQKDPSWLYFFYRYIRCNISNFFVRSPVINIVWDNWMNYAKLVIKEKEI